MTSRPNQKLKRVKSLSDADLKLWVIGLYQPNDLEEEEIDKLNNIRETVVNLGDITDLIQNMVKQEIAIAQQETDRQVMMLVRNSTITNNVIKDKFELTQEEMERYAEDFDNKAKGIQKVMQENPDKLAKLLQDDSVDISNLTESELIEKLNEVDVEDGEE